MAWFDWFQRSPAPVIEHPRLGPLQAAHRPSSGPWLWETLDFVETRRGRADLTFDAGKAGPTKAQEQAWESIIDQIDSLTLAAAALVGPELREWLERPFPVDPWDELQWQGAHISQRLGQFEISYGCRSWPDAMITVHFEQRKPTMVQIDD
jgi:hypothetical protein